MKNRDVDSLACVVSELCRELDSPRAIGRLHWLMVGLVEMARTGKTWRALDVAFEANAFLVEMAETNRRAAGARASSLQYNRVSPVSVDAPPKPAATIDQMRAAADAAMAADDEMDEYECDVCHKVTLVPLDSGTPKGWTDSENPDGEEYRCVECSTFGVKP